MEEATSAPPLTRHGQLEVDAFCARCHYNLHGQEVWVDQNLNFPVCRCPECGQHHPAGSGITAHSVWLRRFASMLLTFWIFLVLFISFLVCLGFGGMQTAHVEAFSYWVPNNSNAQQYIPHHTIQPPPSYNADNQHEIQTLIIICLVSLVLGFLVGAMIVTLLWHWPKWRYYLVILLPAIAAIFVIAGYSNDPSYADILNWCVNRIAFQFAVQCIGIFFGIIFGRKLARLIVRSIIPPKSRQLLAFLWRVDDKPVPSS